MTATPKFSPPDVTPAQLANALRMLAADAVETAKSGHPGMPLGMAEIAEAVWRRHLRHNPANPAWPCLACRAGSPANAQHAPTTSY